jgi:hypothetical protein
MTSWAHFLGPISITGTGGNINGCADSQVRRINTGTVLATRPTRTNLRIMAQVDQFHAFWYWPNI